MIPQANITLNLLRNTRLNPKLSAYTYIYSQFNFLATPIAPPRTKVVAYISLQKRATWELNREVGWYVEPLIDHYRVTLKDYLKQVVEDMITILTQPPKNNILSIQARDPTRNAILQIVKLLKRVEHIPELVEEIIHENDISALRIKPMPIPNESYNLPRTPTTIPCNIDEITTDIL